MKKRRRKKEERIQGERRICRKSNTVTLEERARRDFLENPEEERKEEQLRFQYLEP